MQMDLFSSRRKFSGDLVQSGFLLQEEGNSTVLFDEIGVSSSGGGKFSRAGLMHWGFFFRRRKIQQSFDCNAIS
jgi:hypothetical protein